MDDASVFCSDDNIKTLFETGTEEKQINDSSIANEISLNVEKTKHVLLKLHLVLQFKTIYL